MPVPKPLRLLPLYWLAAAAGALAQTPPAPGPAPPALPAPPEGEVTLIFEREIFEYPAGGRRDPFKSLGEQGLGPLFEELTLQGIVYSPVPGQSLALLATGTKGCSQGAAGSSGAACTARTYRVRRGQMVGNARVIDVAADRVTFVVETFGVVRQEVLELKRRGAEGAEP